MAEITKKDAVTTNPLMLRITEGKNPRGIPTAKFIENVDEFLQEGETVELILGVLNELYSKYKYMEKSFDNSKAVYKQKVPDITQTLDMVKLLIARREENPDEEVLVNYSLSDTLYAKAKITPNVGKVNLWIGASTMVEYTYEEAVELLELQLIQTHAKIEELNEDLYHLRGSSITIEVNMARLFNYSVKLKKLQTATATAGVSNLAVK